MMTKSLLAALLVLGSSTAALAKPAPRKKVVVKSRVVVRDHRRPAPEPAPRVRDHRGWFLPPIVARPPVDTCSNVRIGATASVYTGPLGVAAPWGEWTALTQPTMIARGSEQIAIGKGNGRFTQLRLVANSGSTYISQVVVQFGNGKYQTVAVNRSITAGSPLAIDLKGQKGRAVTQIIVQGSSGYGARYSILAA
jgi:hypothetical protein